MHAAGGGRRGYLAGQRAGQYSNVGASIQQEATPGQTFLRGHQFTDEDGIVEFDTIVPGWEAVAAPPPVNWATRTTHIHVKICREWQVFDTQLYFPDELIDGLYADVEPYRSHSTPRVPGSDRELSRMRNVDDQGCVLSNSQPMSVEREGGRLSASATIGTLAMGNRRVATPFFRGVPRPDEAPIGDQR